MDIVKRLRENGSCMSDIACCYDILSEAADEIERLKQINERFAKILNGERVVMPADGHWSHIYGTEGE